MQVIEHVLQCTASALSKRVPDCYRYALQEEQARMVQNPCWLLPSWLFPPLAVRQAAIEGGQSL